MTKYIENIELVNGVKYKINTVPKGGVEGQVLTKTGEGREDLQWVTPEKFDDSQIQQDLQTLQADKADKETTYTKEDVDALIKDFLTEVPEEFVTEEELEAKNLATQEAMTQALAEKQDKGDYALRSELPVNVSQLNNDAGYLTTIPEEFITETELEAKAYLVAADIAGKADEATVNNKLDAKADKADTYTKEEVDDIITNAVVEGKLDLTDYAKVSEVNAGLAAKADVATTYTKTEVDNLLDNFVTDIPEEYVTEDELTAKGFALKTELPKNVSELQNDAQYITMAQVEAKNYLVAADIENKANKADVYTKQEIDGKLTGALHYKGNVADEKSLPADAEQGDVYNNLENGANYAFNGEAWDKLSETLDLSVFYTKEQADAKFTTLDVVNAQGFLKQDALDPYAKLTDIPTDFYTQAQVDGKLADKADKTSVEASVQQLQQAIDGKQVAGDYAVKSDLTGLIKIEDVEAKGYATTEAMNQQLALKANQETTYTKTEVDEKIAGAVSNGTLDLSDYAKTADVNNSLAGKADKEDTYTKAEVNELIDDFLTEIPVDYVTEEELADKGFATTQQLEDGLAEKQDKGDYALRSELEPYSSKEELNQAKLDLIELINGKQAAADYALKSDLTPITQQHAQDMDAINQNIEALSLALDNKQAVGDYALNSAVTAVQQQHEQDITTLSLLINGKQDKGDYALKEELAPLATKEEVATKQNILTAGPGVFIENDVISAVGFEASYDEETSTLVFSAPSSYSRAYNLTGEILGEQ